MVYNSLQFFHILVVINLTRINHKNSGSEKTHHDCNHRDIFPKVDSICKRKCDPHLHTTK